MLIVCLFILIKTYYIQWNKNKNIFSCHLFFSTECHGKSGLLGDAARNHSGPAVDHRCRIRNSLCTLRYESTQFLFHALMARRRTSFKYQSIKTDFYGESSFFLSFFVPKQAIDVCAQLDFSAEWQPALAVCSGCNCRKSH